MTVLCIIWHSDKNSKIGEKVNSTLIDQIDILFMKVNSTHKLKISEEKKFEKFEKKWIQRK